MMPSAKIVTRDRFPPENMSYSPNIVFLVCSARSASASGFTPGVGMWFADAIHRQQAEREQHALAQLGNREDVLEVRRSCSGLRNDVGRSAGRRDLLRGRLAELVRLHRQRVRDLAPAEHLDRRYPCRAAGRARAAVGRDDACRPRTPSRSRPGSRPRTRPGTGLWNPRLGTRRCSGIWPPSNPRFCLNPDRDCAPLWPRPAVLPESRALTAADALALLRRAGRAA